MSSSLRSRCAKAWYSSQRRSQTALAADFVSTQRPASSVKVASMSRTDSPRAYISTASRVSSSLLPASAERTSLVQPLSPLTCGAANSITPSALSIRPLRTPLRSGRAASPAARPCT